MPDRRILSVDVFRGLAVAAMVLVNNPGTWGAVYGPLRHADWHGWTPTDLIFPFFLFIVGAAIPVALGRRFGDDQRRAHIVRRILRRSAVIFALGLILHVVSNPDASTIRIPGVLQRIAVCYLVAALFFVFTGWRVQAGAAVIALLGYWALLTLLPVPGFGPGDLGKEGNLAAWLDRTLLGPHIWRVGRVYDPKGILSTVPGIATTLFDVLTGHFIRAARSATVTVRGLVIGGAAGMAIVLARVHVTSGVASRACSRRCCSRRSSRPGSRPPPHRSPGLWAMCCWGSSPCGRSTGRESAFQCESGLHHPFLNAPSCSSCISAFTPALSVGPPPGTAAD